MTDRPKHFVTQKKTEHHAELLSNRVRKRHKHLAKRFKRQNIDCFRLYDWDIPEVRAVVDWYKGHVVIAEYERLQTGADWLPQMAEAVQKALNLAADHVHIKRRRTSTKEGPRYRKMNSSGKRFVVQERDLKFWVNLDDFLDTGLYSDHRDTRVMIRELSCGQDFLNLYAYTGAFTCAAIAGGAKTSVTVDRKALHLNWVRDNLKLNGLVQPDHFLAQSDVLKYLAQIYRKDKRFTLAFVDPPSFSKDHKEGTTFDVNLEHPDLLRAVLKVMVKGATVVFSTNHQRFEPNFKDLPIKDLRELTPQTIPEDYRNRNVHRSWQMTAV